jgi:hypothetical protein
MVKRIRDIGWDTEKQIYRELKKREKTRGLIIKKRK